MSISHSWIYILFLVGLNLITVSCRLVSTVEADKISKVNGATAIQFKGIDAIKVEAGYIALSWPQAVSDQSAVMSYEVYAGKFATLLQTTTDLSLLLDIKDYKTGDTLEFSVRAIDGAKNKDGNDISKSIQLSDVPFCTPFSILSATAASDTRVNLLFTRCSGATEYSVYNKASPNQAAELLTTINATDADPQLALLNGLAPGKTLNLSIRAYDSTTNTGNPIGSKDSNSMQVTTLSESLPQFDGIATAIPKAGTAGMTEIDLTWKRGRVSGAGRSVRYHIYRGSSADAVFAAPVATSTTVNNATEGHYISSGLATTTTITGLAPATTYYFAVRAYELDGDGNVLEELNDLVIGASTRSPDESVPPTITAITPTFDVPAGGATVSVTGTNFNPGSKIKFDGVDATSTTWISSTSMSAVVPAHSAGVVNLSYVSSTNVTATLTQGFSYTANAAPTLTSVDKPVVNKDGGVVVTASGTGFLAGAKVVVAGHTITPTSFSASTIVFTTVGASAGAYHVVVRNPDFKTATLTNGITFIADPTLTSLSPGVVAAAGGGLLTVNGTNFADPMTVTIGGSNCINVSVVNTTQLTCTTPARAAGTVDLVVSNQAARTATLSNALIVTANAAPVISAISPAAGATGGGNVLTVTGTGFTAGAVVKVGTSICTAGTLSSTSITCTMPSSAAGSKQVIVLLTDTQESNARTYVYTAAPGPFITSVTPTVGYWPLGSSGTGPELSIAGSQFSLTGGSISISGSDCPITSATATAIVCTRTPKATGTYSLTVTNSDGQVYTLANAVTYSATLPPTLTTVTPANGATAGGTSLTLSGTGFVSGATVKINGATCTSPSVLSSTTLTCTSPSNATAGSVDVVVQNPDTQTGTKANGFLYLGPITATSVLPSQGSTSGGTAITITGTGFASPAAVSINNAACTSVVVVSTTSITCNTPGNAAGTYAVRVTNPDGQFFTLSNAFTHQPGPNISSISPAQGSPSGGTTVVVTGTNFYTGVSMTIGGQACATFTRDSNTQLTCVTPARANATVSQVNVVVTNVDTQTFSLANGYTYNQFSRVDLVWGRPERHGYMDSNVGSDVRFRGFVQYASDGTFLYASDNGNRVIRKIHMTTGATTTLAGNSTLVNCSASTDGTGATANFISPMGLVIDSTNTYLYMTDPSCNATYRVTIATGETQVWANTGYFGWLAIDATDTALYATNAGNSASSAQAIYRLNLLTGVSSVFSGSAGTAGSIDSTNWWAARFANPQGIVRVGNNLYVADYNNHVIKTVSLVDGSVTTLAGTQPDSGTSNGTGSAARFNGPVALTTDGTNLYVGENYSPHGTIRKVVISSRVVTTLIAGVTSYVGNTAWVANADGVLPSVGKWFTQFEWAGSGTTPRGSLYANSTYLYESGYDLLVRRFEFATNKVKTLAGEFSATDGVAVQTTSADGTGTNARFAWGDYNFTSPVTSQRTIHLTTDGTYLYTSEMFGNGGFSRLDPVTLSKTSLFGSSFKPTGATVAGGFAYISNGTQIQRCAFSNGVCTAWSGAATGTGSAEGTGFGYWYNYLQDLVNDGTNIYAADRNNFLVRRINISTSAASRYTGTFLNAGNTDGIGTAAQFWNITGLTLAGTDLYVADPSQHCIRKIDTLTATVSTFVGLCGTSGYVNSTAPGAVRFNAPVTITSDNLGNLYIGDRGNTAVRKVEIASRATTTVAGRGTLPYGNAKDGTIDVANIPTIQSIVYLNGKIYVASDLGIRVIQ